MTADFTDDMKGCCMICGFRQPGGKHHRRRRDWIAEVGWAICFDCLTVYRDPQHPQSLSYPEGWVVPFSLLRRSLESRFSSNPGVFVDCSPSGFLMDHSRSLFATALTFKELLEVPSLQAQDITCSSFLEISEDAEAVLRRIFHHLGDGGILRISLLFAPFKGLPQASISWLSARHIKVQQVLSQRGLNSLLNRVGLSVQSRRRTLHIAMTPRLGVPLGAKRGLFSPWNALPLCLDRFRSGKNVGFGQELVLCRKQDLPPTTDSALAPRKGS
jgi:hypothetical protein